MDHLDLAGVLTTPPQWNLPAFEQQDAIYLSSSRQMLEPIMEETSEDEENALNSWPYQEQHNNSESECGTTTEGESICGGTGGAGGASFWSSAESDTGSVIRIEVNKDNDSTSERDFLCPAKRPRRCEESLLISNEEEVILRRPVFAHVEKNNSLERFLNYENFSRDSWGTNSQQRSSVGSRRGFDDFYSDSDSLSYNSLSRSSSLIQFESLERQLLMQEQHASMNSLGNSSPSLLSFENQEDVPNKTNNNSGNSSANNSRRGSQSSLLKKYESLDGRLHQTYYDLDKLNFDDMDNTNNESFNRNTNLKLQTHMAELRSDSETSSEGSEGSSRLLNKLSPNDCNDNEFLFKKFNRCNNQQNKKGKNSAENLSEDSGYCEPSMGFGLRRSKSQTLMKNYEKFSEEEEEMENKSLIALQHYQKQTFNNDKIKLENDENDVLVLQNKKHSLENEFKINNNRQQTPPQSPHLEYIRHKQRLETHSPSPVSSEVSTSSSTSSTNSNNSTASSSSSSSASSTSSSATSTSSATTCASKASFTWLKATANATKPPLINQQQEHDQQHQHHHHLLHHHCMTEEEEIRSYEISLNDLCEQTTSNVKNVENLTEKLNFINKFPLESENFKENLYCLECGNNLVENNFKLQKCCEKYRKFIFKNQKCLDYNNRIEKDLNTCEEKPKINEKENCGEFVDHKIKVVNTDKEFNREQREEIKCENRENLNECKEQKSLILSNINNSLLENHNFNLITETNYNYNLMPHWPNTSSSVPNELNTIGRQKNHKNQAFTDFPSTEYNNFPSLENLPGNKLLTKRSLSWSFQLLETKEDSPEEFQNLALIHQSYHNLANLDLEQITKTKPTKNMADKRISSDYETEIVCKNNFLLDELSAHYDRTASILNDQPIDQVDHKPKAPQRQLNRKLSQSSCSAGEESENDQIQHVQLVIRKPPARQKRQNQHQENKANSLTQDFTFSSIMQSGLNSPNKTFDQDPTILKTSYAQSLEKCNFDCKELSTQDLSKSRSLPKRRFQSQANNAKKKSLVSSTPNLNAYDFHHQDEIEDDLFVSSAHTSMHQLNSTQQKPLGILLTAGSKTSFGKEVSFCPVVSKYCWQEQSSEECTEGNEDYAAEQRASEESEDELLDNADATVIYNTKENEMIASKYNEEFLKKEQEEQFKQRKNEQENERETEFYKEKAIIKELNTKQQVDYKVKENKESQQSNKKRDEDNDLVEENKREQQRETLINGNETPQQEELEKQIIINKEERKENETLDAKLLLPTLNVSLTTNVNNETLKTNAQREHLIEKPENNVNLKNNLQKTQIKPTVVVARPLSIQLPILSEPPINRAHHILYASQQMLDNFQKQQENEQYQHQKSQSTQNLSKMSGKTNEIQTSTPTQLNNNNEIMKSKFKHEEKHPNSKGFLSRFANGFRFSLRRNKKKLQKENQQQLAGEELTKQTKSNSLPANHKPTADFIHIPLKGPLPNKNNGNTNQISATNGNTGKNTTLLGKQKGAKSKQQTEQNDKQQKVTGKPPIPPHQLQQLQSAQSSQLQQQQQPQQPLVEVGFSRFYTESNNLIENPKTATQDFLNHEQNQQQEFTQSCANHHQQQDFTVTNNVSPRENVTNMTTQTVNTNTNNIATPATSYLEFTSPSRATVSQKTQMFNNLSRQSQPQPKIGLIETNLDTHETVITGKTRSLINIGPNQQRYAGNKRSHHNNSTLNSSQQHQQSGYNHDADDDDDVYDDNDDDEVVVRPDGTVVVIKNAGNSSSQSAQIASVRRPHKSMEFLLDKENQKDVMTTSEDSLMELQSPEVSNLSGKPLRKKKLRRSLTMRKEHSVLEPNTLFSTDSDSDCKTPKIKQQSCTLPKSKKCSNYVKKLVFKTLNSSMPAEPSSLLNNELSILELDRSLIRQVNSPSKIKNAYTLTVMSSPSPHSESDFYDSDLPRTPMKESSRSWPSLLEAQMEEDAFSLKDKSVSTEFTDMAKSKLEQEQQKLLMDSFIDQGFETGSNDMDSPLRITRKIANNIENSATKRENPKNFSTPLKDKPVQRVFTALQGSSTQSQLISPIQATQSPRRPASLTMTVIKEDSYCEDSQELYNTPSSLNDSQTFFGQEETEQPLSVTHKVNSSQFWVTSGDFTAAMTIHHYESERLMLLSNIYGQKSLETKEMNFGIDEHKFSLDNSATSDDIIKKVPKENNCSQYWFSTGDVLIPFTGKQLSTQKIQSFFGYIREFMEDSGCLRFGIDSYEFSNIYQQTHNASTHFMGTTWTQAVSQLKTSDLDQSDLDSEEFEQSLTFSAISQHSDTASLKSDVLINPQLNSFQQQQSSGSLEQIFEDARHLNLSKTQTDKQALEAQFTVPEMLKTLQNQQTKLKSLEERMLQCTDSVNSQKTLDINESPEYMRKLRSIISAIDNIGRGNGFNACTIEQLESFMFFLSRYADLCLANCTAHIEKILDVVMNQRSFQV